MLRRFQIIEPIASSKALVVGVVVSVTIMTFAGEASAATSQPAFISLSFSETFAVVLIALALMGAIILFVKESN